MAVKIYKKSGVIIIDGLNPDINPINTSAFDWGINNGIYTVRDKIENQSYRLGIFSNIQNEIGVAYSSDEELQTALSTFTNSTNITTTEGNELSVQYPIPVDGDSVHAKDVDPSNSDLGNFTGKATDPFDDLHSENIDSTGDAIKTLLIHFHRTIVTPLIGLGSSEGGSFSNVKVIAVVSGGVELVLRDNSLDNTDRTSQFYTFPNAGLNALKLEFHTTDAISITNIFIPKLRPVSAIMETTVKYATSYKSPYLLNTGSQAMNVNGSITPVDFEYEITGSTTARWYRSFIDLQDGTQNFDPENFAAITALTNGVDIIVVKDGVETVLENWKKNMDISMTMYNFDSPFKIGAYIGRWTINSDIGSPITLFPGDKIIARVRDNLTSIDAFRIRLKLSQ